MFDSTTPTTIDQRVKAASQAKMARDAVASEFKHVGVELGLQPIELFDKQTLIAAVKGLIGKTGNSIPAKFYIPAIHAHWTGNGNPPKAFSESHAFDKANPDASPKKMAQFLISDDTAKEVALKIKKDVKTRSGQVIKYADLVAQPSA